MKNKLIILLLLLFSTEMFISCVAQQSVMNYQKHWEVTDGESIYWNLENNQNLPHTDNIEMAGRKVAGIITYQIDTLGMIFFERQIFFPQLHPFIKETDPGWLIYRAYQKDIYADDILPKLFVNEKQFVPGIVRNVQINGTLVVEHKTTSSGLSLKRMFYPDVEERLFIERWELTNSTDSTINITSGNTLLKREDYGKDGKYTQRVITDAPEQVALKAGDTFSFSIQIMAKIGEESFPKTTAEKSFSKRDQLLEMLSQSLILETPDTVLNTLFNFSKIRASESIFDSKLGLIHSPGGGRYYVGIWANDQAEYVSPLFPYLGYDIGNQSAMNCYRAFAKEMDVDYTPIRYAFEIEGLVPPFKLDRGDAAMIAYGATQFALAKGKKEAEELWPSIAWCLEYCHQKLNEEGVVQSESDEMEGRIETGNANLSTSALYFGALENASFLAAALLKNEQVELYSNRSEKLNQSIEKYFGTTVEGLDTYKYYKEHRRLRHWICLPLVVGIHDRKEATIEALFDRLWANENGVYVEKNSENKNNSEIFWDRGTLYALRGTFFAGATELSLQKLKEYSVERLLGRRVPYAVEAFPEGSMAHLSAESGLYCRIFTEGMFGIVPTGFDRFNCTPRLPESWPDMKLKHIKAFDDDFDISVSRNKKKIVLSVFSHKTNEVVLDQIISDGETVSVKLK